VKPIAVERWLNEMPVARGTRYKTKGVMSVLFQHAMRYEWAATNPIRLVRQSAMPVQALTKKSKLLKVNGRGESIRTSAPLLPKPRR
jgi:hypothetical protein